MADLLLKNGAEINYVPEKDKNLLMYAVRQGNIELINYLLDKGFSPEQTDADSNGALMYLAETIKEYPDLSDEVLVAKIKEITETLQAKGADINRQNDNGETLLIKIAKLKTPHYSEIANALIKLGALTDKKDQYGKTAADYARQ